MKKVFVCALIASTLVFQFCSPSKKSAAPTPPPQPPAVKVISFEGDVKPLIQAHCAPCHVNGDRSFTILANAKAHIDETITRIQMDKGDHGFMPMRGEKLADSTIQVFVKWKAGGLLEK